MLGELAQQQELQPGERHRPVADVCDQPSHIQRHVARPDCLRVRVCIAVLACLTTAPRLAIRLVFGPLMGVGA
jgi:hypothetical protein